MTPFEIDVFLHHACSHSPYERASAPIYPGTVQEMERAGLLWKEGETYRPTSLGLAFKEMLCSTPLPAFTDPRTGKEVPLSLELPADCEAA